MLNELKCRMMEKYDIDCRIYEGMCQDYLCFDIDNFKMTIYDDTCGYFTVEVEDVVDWSQILYQSCYSYDFMLKVVENIVEQF